MTTDDLLEQGIAALKAGRKAEAHGLLMQVVEQGERNEMAWLWLSGAVDTDEERRTCLENVLAINPNNGVARRGLESLIAKEGVRPLSAVSSPAPRTEPATTPREQPTQFPVEASAPDVTRRKKRKEPPKRKKATKKQRGLMIGLGVGVLVLACVALVGIWWAIDSELLPLGPAMPVAVGITRVPPTEAATPTPIPSPTRIPTWTPTPRSTHTPSFGSLERPVPFGEALELTQGEATHFQVAVIDAYRGDEAWQILYTENKFNDPPPAGMEYVRLYIEVQCLEGSSSDPLRIARWDFNLLSKGRVFDPAILVEPKPTFDEFTLFPGGSAEGWMTFLVHMDDPEPLLVIGMDSSEEGGWYLTVESSTRPTTIPTPTPTPIPTVVIQTQTLGPIWNSTRDESYTAQISLTGVRFNSEDDWHKPKQGYVYVIVDVTVKNLGPDLMRSVSDYDFQVRDASGALRDSSWLVPGTDDCELDLVDLALNGSVSGCIGFEVPADGKLELIFAPYKYEALEPGRYLSFTIRR